MRRIIILESAYKDLAWFRRYYRFVFPEGKLNASAYFQKIVHLVAENPFAGQAIENLDLRRFPIPRTPFVLLYRIATDDDLELVRVLDGRQQPQEGFHED